MDGPFVIFIFLVPASITDAGITTPVVNGSSTAVFEISNDLFDRSSGEILYYAIIIGLVDNHENSTFGHWDGVTWPSVGSSSRFSFLRSSGLPYQATPNFWNPFTEGKS